MLSTKTKIFFWQFDDQELTDPELIDKLLLSLCSNSGISYPHFKLHLLVSELISNAIDHGVLALHSRLKYSSEGFEDYLIERSRRLGESVSGRISFSAEWTENKLLRICVQDSGAGFDFTAYSDKCKADDVCAVSLHGRGLVIVNSLCQSVTHLGNGNTVVVEFDPSAD